MPIHSQQQLRSYNNQKGQVIVEYVLLLAIATIIAMIIRNALVRGGSDGDAGALIKKWGEISSFIGSDDPNKR